MLHTLQREAFSLKSNMDSVEEFLSFSDPSHKLDPLARLVLTTLLKRGENELPPHPANGHLVCVTKEQLGLGPDFQGLSEESVWKRVAELQPKTFELGFVLDLWAAPLRTPVQGVVHMQPIADDDGASYRLGVYEAEDGAERLLYATAYNSNRRWPHDRKLIFTAP